MELPKAPIVAEPGAGKLDGVPEKSPRRIRVESDGESFLVLWFEAEGEGGGRRRKGMAVENARE